MIEVTNLTKQYGKKRAVDNISFSVDAGEILGFLGPNGAGKSTTMNILTGYISSTSGTVKIDGIDILEEPLKAKKKIGYLPEMPPLYVDMTVEKYLRFMYELKKVTLPRDAHINEICQTVKIEDVKHRLIKNLSKGYRQRVGLAQALLGYPEVLILDEPTVGLDPQQIIEIRNLIRDLGQKHTIILSSHILPEVQAVCDRVIVIAHGKLVANDTPDHLTIGLSQNKLQVTVEGDEQTILQTLQNVEHVLQVSKLKENADGSLVFSVEAESDQDIRRQLSFALAQAQLGLLSLQVEAMSLEDVFLELVENESKDTQLDEQTEETADEEPAEVFSVDGQSESDSSNVSSEGREE